MFVGRGALFNWLQINLSRPAWRRPLFLHGRPGLGKTSLLRQVEGGRLGAEFNVIYVDLGVLSLEEPKRFVWELTKAALASLESRAVYTPQLEKRMFTLRPRQAFIRHFWEPVLNRLDGRRLLVAFDNVDAVAFQKGDSPTSHDVLAFLHDLRAGKVEVDYVFTMGNRPESLDGHTLAPFDSTLSERIRNLSRSETGRLIRQRTPYHVFDDITDYVYELTGGHPADVQRVGRALFERHRQLGLRQITLADVVAVLAKDLQASDFYTAVYQRRSFVTVRIPDNRIAT